MYGNSFKSCLVAVVVPKTEALVDWAKEAGRKGEELAAGHCRIRRYCWLGENRNELVVLRSEGLLYHCVR